MESSLPSTLHWDIRKKNRVEIYEEETGEILRSLRKRKAPKGPAWIDEKYSNPIVLGGSYGTVLKMDHEDYPTKKFAVKFAVNLFRNLSDAKRNLREILILKRISHPNIVKIWDILPPTQPEFNEIAFVMEAEKNTLKSLMYSETIFTTENELLHILYQLLNGLQYLKTNCIIHRDLKPANILVTKNMNVKICDFGLGRTVKKESSYEEMMHDSDFSMNESPKLPLIRRMTQNVVTKWYRAPEVMLTCGSYSYEVDMWAMGCILGEMIKSVENSHALTPKCFPSLSKPQRLAMFPGENVREILEMIVEFIGNPHDTDLIHLTNDGAQEIIENLPSYDGVDMYKFFSKTSPDIVDILRQMLIFEPKNRIDPENVLELSLFDGVRDQTLEDASNIDHKVDISIAENVTMETASYRNILLEELFPYLRNGGPIFPRFIFEENLRRRLVMCEELKERKKRDSTSSFDPSSNISYGDILSSNTTTDLSSGSCNESSLQTIEMNHQVSTTSSIKEYQNRQRNINSHGEISWSSSRCSLSSNLSGISSNSSVHTEDLEKEDEVDLKLPLLSSQKLENPIIRPLTRTVRFSFISSDGDEQKGLKEDEEELKKEEMDLNNSEDKEEEIMVGGNLLVRKLDPLHHEIQDEKKKSDLDEEEEEEKKKMKSQSENLLCDPDSNNNKLPPIENKKSVSDTGLQQSPSN